MLGLMQDHPLLVSSLLVHADRHHGDTEIVSRTIEGPIHRATVPRNPCTRAPSRQCADGGWAWASGDRVATLAWNGYRHLEIYFAVSGMGAVCHTINPRLFQRSDRLHHQPRRGPLRLLRSHLRAAGRRRCWPRCPEVKALGGDDRCGAHGRRAAGIALLRELARRGDDAFDWPRPRRADGVVAVLHLGHHRQSQGRALFAPLDRAAHLCRRARRLARPVGARRGAAGGADVPRQCLGPALHLHDGRRRRW